MAEYAMHRKFDFSLIGFHINDKQISKTPPLIKVVVMVD
jgi:hypothetical protein